MRARFSIKISAIILSDSPPSLNCNLEQKEIDCSPENNPTNGYKCNELS